MITRMKTAIKEFWFLPVFLLGAVLIIPWIVRLAGEYFTWVFGL